MPTSSVARVSLVDQIIGQLHTAIESGEWPIGSRIPTEAELVDQFGVGRNTVREGIRALTHAGLLEARQGDGTYVRASNELDAAILRRLRRSSMVEVLEVRNSIERDGAWIAATRRTPQDLQAIRARMDAQIALIGTGTPDEIVDADLAFHRSIIAAAHNGVALDLYSSFMDALREAVLIATAPYTAESVRLDEHLALYRAIEQGDGALAEKAARMHLRHSLEAIATATHGNAIRPTDDAALALFDSAHPELDGLLAIERQESPAVDADP